MSDDELIRKSDADAAIVKCKGNGATRQNCRDGIAALPAASTFTAADLERAYRLALQDAWLKAFSIPSGQRTLKAIRALTPPAGLAQRVKGPAHD